MYLLDLFSEVADKMNFFFCSLEEILAELAPDDELDDKPRAKKDAKKVRYLYIFRKGDVILGKLISMYLLSYLGQ